MFDFQRLCSQLCIALSAPPVSFNLFNYETDFL
nr:MAG TPA: hypothetical protein [Microviridae sp.]